MRVHRMGGKEWPCVRLIEVAGSRAGTPLNPADKSVQLPLCGAGTRETETRAAMSDLKR